MSRRKLNWKLFASLIVFVGLTYAAFAVVREMQWESGESARAVRCASNMRQIAFALTAYAEKHGGRFPDKLEDIELGPTVLQCPSNRKVKSQPSYRYLGKGLTTSDSTDTPLLREEQPYHPLSTSRRMNIAFLDGRVTDLPIEEAEKIIDRMIKLP